MKEEPFFLVNDFLEKERGELEKVIEIVNVSTVKHLEKAAFLKNFTNLLFKAHKSMKLRDEDKELEKHKLKEELLKRKQTLLKKLEEHKSLLEMQEDKPIKEQLKLPSKLSEVKDLILSKESGQPFVTTEFSDGVYTVKEPSLNGAFLNILTELKNLDIEDKEKLRDIVRGLCIKCKVEYSDNHYDILRYYLIRDKKKFGRITPLIEDKDISEIVCPGPSKFLTVKYRGNDDVSTNIVFDNEDQVNTLLKNIASKTKQEISNEKPFLNVALGNMGISGNVTTAFLKPKFVIVKQLS